LIIVQVRTLSAETIVSGFELFFLDSSRRLAFLTFLIRNDGTFRVRNDLIVSCDKIRPFLLEPLLNRASLEIEFLSDLIEMRTPIEMDNTDSTTTLLIQSLLEDTEENDKDGIIRRFAVSFQTVLFSKLDRDVDSNNSSTNLPVPITTRTAPYVVANATKSSTILDVVARYVKLVFCHSQDRISSSNVVRAVLPSLIVGLMDFAHLRVFAADILDSALKLFCNTRSCTSSSWLIELRRMLATLIGRCTASLISSDDVVFKEINIPSIFRAGLTSSAIKVLEPCTLRDRLSTAADVTVETKETNESSISSSSLKHLESCLKNWAIKMLPKYRKVPKRVSVIVNACESRMFAAIVHHECLSQDVALWSKRDRLEKNPSKHWQQVWHAIVRVLFSL